MLDDLMSFDIAKGLVFNDQMHLKFNFFHDSLANELNKQ